MSQPLIHNSARVLEFDALRELLRGYSSSPLGDARNRALAPSTDSAWIAEQQELTAEVREFRRVGGRFDFSGLLDITKLVEKSRIAGAALETTEIRDVLLVVDRAAEWREIALHPPANMKTEWHGGCELSRADVPDFTDFLRSFATRFCPMARWKTMLRPNWRASAARSKSSDASIQESLRGYLRRLAEGGTVQDELVTIRGERFVIPVKIEQKRRVQGVVHGASSSGQTVFVEPLETIEQNNELVRLLDEEQAEIHRILLEMTRRIGEQAAEILAAVEVLSRTGIAVRQSALRRRLQLRAVRLSSCRKPAKSKSGQPLAACPERSRRVRERSSPPSPQRPPPAAGAQLESQRAGGSPNQRRTRRRAPAAHDHRSEHRRQNSSPKTVGLLALDGAIGNSRSRRPRGDAGVRCRARRYWRLPIDRAESLNFLRARHQHRFHFAHRDRALAGTAR